MTLLEEANAIQSYLEIECSGNPEEIINRINAISVYMARSGEMLAQAKRLLKIKQRGDIQDIIMTIAKEGFLCASLQKVLLDSYCEDEAFLVDLLDRINATCKHQIDALRSLLSYEKESLRMNKTGY